MQLDIIHKNFHFLLQFYPLVHRNVLHPQSQTQIRARRYGLLNGNDEKYRIALHCIAFLKNPLAQYSVPIKWKLCFGFAVVTISFGLRVYLHNRYKHFTLLNVRKGNLSFRNWYF